MKPRLIAALAVASIGAFAIQACASFGNYVGNPTIDAAATAVNNDLLKIKADYAAHASATVMAADTSQLVADSAALDAAIKAAGTPPH